MDLETIKKNREWKPVENGTSILMPTLEEVSWLIAKVERLTAVEVKAKIYEEALQVIANSHPFRTTCIDLAETALSEAAEAVRP